MLTESLNSAVATYGLINCFCIASFPSVYTTDIIIFDLLYPSSFIDSDISFPCTAQTKKKMYLKYIFLFSVTST